MFHPIAAKMRKLLFYILAALPACLSAGIGSVDAYTDDTPFYQFVEGDFNGANGSGQNWLAAKTIIIHVGSAMDIWLSNYVNSWYGDIPALNGNEFRMGTGQYGAYDLNSGRNWVGTGDTATVTYADANGAGRPNSTEAYYLGHFNGGEDLVLWLTSIESDAATSTQLVNNGEFDPTALVSRVNGTRDIAGNWRLNFGYIGDDGYIGHELVAFGSYGNFAGGDGNMTGQPLPGVLASALIAGGVAVTCRWKRRVAK